MGSCHSDGLRERRSPIVTTCAGMGAKLLSATENIDDTPAGQLLRGILASINQYRSASEGEDIVRKLAHQARQGGTIGWARLGYHNVKEDIDGRQVSTLAIDETRGPLIRKGFELYAPGECWATPSTSAWSPTRARSTPDGTNPWSAPNCSPTSKTCSPNAQRRPDATDTTSTT